MLLKFTREILVGKVSDCLDFHEDFMVSKKTLYGEEISPFNGGHV